MKKITIDKVYSVANKNYIQFKMDMSDGSTYSIFNDNGHFNVKQMTKVIDGVVTDIAWWGGNSCWTVNTNDVDVVQSAVFLVANNLIKKPNSFKSMTKTAITRATNKWLKAA